MQLENKSSPLAAELMGLKFAGFVYVGGRCLEPAPGGACNCPYPKLRLTNTIVAHSLTYVILQKMDSALVADSEVLMGLKKPISQPTVSRV